MLSERACSALGRQHSALLGLSLDIPTMPGKGQHKAFAYKKRVLLARLFLLCVCISVLNGIERALCMCVALVRAQVT